jgi:O-antigen/teichoic acid export membrane protein
MVMGGSAPSGASRLRIRETVARNVLSNSLGKVISLGANVVLTPFIVWRVGATEYGLLVLVGSVVTYGTLLDLGMINTVIRHVADFRARGETQRASEVVGTALLLYCALGAIALLLSVAVAPFVPSLFNVPEPYRVTAQRLVLISGVGLGISLPCTVTTSVLRALQRYDLVNAMTVLNTVLYAAATVAVLWSGGGVVALAAVGVASAVAVQPPSLYAIRRAAPDLRFGWRGASRPMARKILSFSSWLLVTDVAGRLQMKTDVLVIGALLPVAAVTPYAVCQKLSRVPKVLADQFVKVLLPLASELHALEDRERLRALYVWSSRLTLAIFVPLGCAVAVLSRDLLSLWMGPAFEEHWLLVVVLVLAIGVDISQWPAGSILQGMARVRSMALVSLATGLANLALSIALAPRLGLLGVAIGTLLPAVVASFGIVIPYAARHIGVPPSELLREVALPSVVPALPAVAVLCALRWSIGAPSPASIAAIGLTGIGTYGLFYLGLGASTAERHAYRSLAASTMRFAGDCLRR